MTKQLINNYFSKVMVNDYEGSKGNLHFGGSELPYLQHTHTHEHTCTHAHTHTHTHTHEHTYMHTRTHTHTRFLTLFSKHFVRLAKSST